MLLAATAVVIAGAAVALLARGGEEDLTARPGTDVAVTKGRHSLDAHNSPAIAQDPDDPDTLVVADKVDRPRFTAALHRSEDGGATWSEVDFPVPEGEDRPYAPELAWSGDGTLYLVFVTLTGPGNNPEAVWLSSSDDAGVTWGEPRSVLDEAYAFQVRVALAPAGDLYLTWLQGSKEATGTLSFIDTGLPILAARSEDGGETWSDPARVSSPARARVGAAVPVVGPGGDVYVLYYDFADDRFDWENLEGDVYSGTFELVLARSGPDAVAFEESVVEPAVEPYERFLVYLPKFPGVAVDSEDGAVYATWADAGAGDPDVFVRRSDDGGETWSEATRVHPGSAQSQYLPGIAVADGRVHVAYLDRRADRRDVRTGVYLATSTDRGRSWSSVPLARTTFSSDLGPEGAPGEADQGTRLDLAATVDRAAVVWTDARRSSELTARLDVFFAAVRFVAR
ncbi:MAG: sialidase family protein [Actinomycetota bacterium]